MQVHARTRKKREKIPSRNYRRIPVALYICIVLVFDEWCPVISFGGIYRPSNFKEVTLVF